MSGIPRRDFMRSTLVVAGAVALTGAAGRIGSYLRSGLPSLGWRLRCLDLAGPAEPDGLPWSIGDVADSEVLAEAMVGVEAVVHLAGIPTEAPFAEAWTSRRCASAAASTGRRGSGAWAPG